MPYQVQIDHPTGNIVFKEDDLGFLDSRIGKFIYGRWDFAALGNITGSLPSDISFFFKAMPGYKYQITGVPEPEDLDEIQLSPLDVEVVCQAILYGGHYLASIAKKTKLQVGEVSDILGRVRNQLQD